MTPEKFVEYVSSFNIKYVDKKLVIALIKEARKVNKKQRKGTLDYE